MALDSSYDLSGVDGARVFRDLPEGIRLQLDDGSVVEIVGNPRDGANVVARIIECPADPSRVDEEDVVYYTEVKGVVLTTERQQ